MVNTMKKGQYKRDTIVLNGNPVGTKNTTMQQQRTKVSAVSDLTQEQRILM